MGPHGEGKYSREKTVHGEVKLGESWAIIWYGGGGV